MWRIFSFIAKAVVSVLLLYLALDWVNVGKVTDRLSQINLYWFALEVLVIAVQVIAFALRWREIVLACDTAFSPGRAFRYSMIAIFFNQTLPSIVGGDAARIWLLARHGAGWRIAAYSVLVDRVIGVMSLALIVTLCLPWTLALISNPVGRTALLLIGFGCLLAGLVFIAMGWRRLRFLQSWAVTRHLADASSIISRLMVRGRAGGLVVALSILIHILNALTAWCAARAVGASLDFAQALFLVLPVTLVAVAPISIAGWGVRETAMVMAFGYAGLPDSDGLLVSLLFGVGSFVVGAVGGLIWILGSERPTAPGWVLPSS